MEDSGLQMILLRGVEMYRLDKEAIVALSRYLSDASPDGNNTIVKDNMAMTRKDGANIQDGRQPVRSRTRRA